MQPAEVASGSLQLQPRFSPRCCNAPLSLSPSVAAPLSKAAPPVSSTLPAATITPLSARLRRRWSSGVCWSRSVLWMHASMTGRCGHAGCWALGGSLLLMRRTKQTTWLSRTPLCLFVPGVYTEILKKKKTNRDFDLCIGIRLNHLHGNRD